MWRNIGKIQRNIVKILEKYRKNIGEIQGVGEKKIFIVLIIIIIFLIINIKNSMKFNIFNIIIKIILKF